VRVAIVVRIVFVAVRQRGIVRRSVGGGWCGAGLVRG